MFSLLRICCRQTQADSRLANLYSQRAVFYNVVLADEISRVTAKVQSALLEAVSENQVTIGE